MDLNPKEQKLLKAFPPPGEPITLQELARACWPKLGVKARGYWWVKNSIRRPVARKLVKQVGRGLYCLTEKGAA